MQNSHNTSDRNLSLTCTSAMDVDIEESAKRGNAREISHPDDDDDEAKALGKDPRIKIVVTVPDEVVSCTSVLEDDAQGSARTCVASIVY